MSFYDLVYGSAEYKALVSSIEYYHINKSFFYDSAPLIYIQNVERYKNILQDILPNIFYQENFLNRLQNTKINIKKW